MMKTMIGILLRKYSSSNTYSWTVKEAGKYNVVVKAKSDNVDEIESNVCTITVKEESDVPEDEKLESVELSVNKTSVKVGDKIVLIATSNYDDGSNIYQFGYYDSKKITGQV